MKKYTGNQLDEVKDLMKYSYEEPFVLHIVEQLKYEFAYMAYEEQNLVGLIVTWKSKLHPYCLYFRVYSNPYTSQNSQKVVLQLLQYVKRNEVLELPLQTSLWESSKKQMELYEQLDMKIIRKTYMPKLDLNQHFQALDQSNFEVKTLKDIMDNQSLMEQLTVLVKRNYEETHLVNPVADLPLKEWQKLYDDAILEGSFLLCNPVNQNIIAYSFLHETEVQTELEIGWSGVDQIMHLPLLQLLTYNQITYAKTNGYEVLIGEFDTTSPYALEILELFPNESCPTWITFQG
ncbi:GNAT family acetyltransferase [Viridibacillus sp. NPDC093762]|uniref:GNAT family acetyltransferase n=1 Tax=Viridibacillus sp. NPDC093762 TaxID=3390720 RepID=UPI003D08BFF1